MSTGLQRPTIDTPAGVEAAELILKLYKLCPPDAIGWAEADLYEAMGSAGVVGMAPAQWAGTSYRVFSKKSRPSCAGQVP